MTGKERLMAAMRREEVDYLPCSIYFNSNLRVRGYDLRNPADRVRLQVDLGCDGVVDIVIPSTLGPEVETRTWLKDVPGQDCPILYKEYQTPAGTLRMGVRHTPDWPHGTDIIWDDHSASNLYEPLIKTADDVDAFEYLWPSPTQNDLDATRDDIKKALRLAKEYGVAVRGYAGGGLATLLFVMGAENSVMFAIDHPQEFKRLAEIDSKANIGRIKLCAQTGADFVKRFGGYEQTNFYNPTIFKEVVAPLLRTEVATAHEAGLLIYYRVVTGMEPLLDDIASIGFDCIEGGEPHLSGCSLEMWHDTFAGKVSSWTGISTPVLLGGDDPEAVRREVRHCADVFGKRGFILGVTNSIRNHFGWENTLAMVDEWKKLR